MKKTGSEFTLLIGRRTECEYKIHFFFGEIDVVTGIFFDSLHIRSNRRAHAEVVQIIGKTIVLYRESREHRRIELPR